MDPKQIKPESSLVDDLGLDSLDAVEMVFELEENYGIEIPDDAAETIQTFGLPPAWKGKATGWLAVLAAIVIIFIFAHAAGWTWQSLPPWLDFLNDPGVIGLIVVVLVFIVVIAYITAEPKEERKEGAIGKIGEEIGKLFGKE